jgi:NitT/TauT family transport system substrate-binding protein
MLRVVTLIVLLKLSLIASNNTIVVAGPSAMVSHPLFDMIKRDAFEPIGKAMSFRQWKNPDELKALILNKKVDYIAAPITASSILYNKGVDIKLTHLLMGGARGVVCQDSSIKSIKDLKSKSLAIPSRGGLGDSLMRILLQKNGIDTKKDIDIVYTQSSKNSTMFLLKAKVDCAIFSEPRLSMTLKKAKSLPSDKLPHKLSYNISILDSYKSAFDTDTTFAQVALLAVSDRAKSKQVYKLFINEYEKSLKWYLKNPKKGSKLVAKHIKGLHPKAIENGIKNSSLYMIRSDISKDKIKPLISKLVEYNPKSMGKKSPNDGFYLEDN